MRVSFTGKDRRDVGEIKVMGKVICTMTDRVEFGDIMRL